MWMAASAHTVWFEDRGLLKPLDLANRLHGGVRLLTRPKAIGLQGAFGADPLWELTCGVKEHLLRINPDTGALTAVGQFAKANYCDAVTSSSQSVIYGALRRLRIADRIDGYGSLLASLARAAQPAPALASV